MSEKAYTRADIERVELVVGMSILVGLALGCEIAPARGIERERLWGNG